MSREFLYQMHLSHNIPKSHIDFLKKLKGMGCEPKVIYDLGSSVLSWAIPAKALWPDAEIVLFDAYEPFEFLYENYKYHIGVLTDKDNKLVKFYQNPEHPNGNSYYKEYNEKYFPSSNYVIKRGKTLDTVVDENKFPLPDLIKMDIQGAEMDVISGGLKTLSHAKYLIVEAQNFDYNLGAPKADIVIPYIKSLGWECVAEKFSVNGPYDADYCFRNPNNA